MTKKKIVKPERANKKMVLPSPDEQAGAILRNLANWLEKFPGRGFQLFQVDGVWKARLTEHGHLFSGPEGVLNAMGQMAQFAGHDLEGNRN